MKIKECIDKVNNLNPNQYSEEVKVDWLSRLDHDIFTEIISTHEYNEDEEPIEYEPYSVNNEFKDLIAPFPYDELYIAYLNMKIDEANKETGQYNNSVVLFTSYYENYSSWYNRTHMPINKARYNNWRH